MSHAGSSWQPTATLAVLQQRAAMLARARSFFADRQVLEVDTPVVVNAPVTDVHIHSAQVHLTPADDTQSIPDGAGFFLHTSPEYAMKRLLAAGSGDIFQICHVVRGFERGRLHNAEFTLIEWYRLGFSLEALMSEVELLVRSLLGAVGTHLASERIPYRTAFARELQIDPLTCSEEDLIAAARSRGVAPAGAVPLERDELLDLLMGAVIGPRLGHQTLTFVHRYPAAQAALARLDPHDARTALRFELYCDGIELANGFDELSSPDEQRARFERDRAERRRRGLPAFGIDERLLAALAAGIPACAGVAVGFDRLVMLATRSENIEAVLPFSIERA